MNGETLIVNGIVYKHEFGRWIPDFFSAGYGRQNFVEYTNNYVWEATFG